MDKLTGDMKIWEYQDILASKAPVPGGGGASAVAASLGACLGHMVGSLTVGKKKYAHVEADILALMKKVKSLIDDFNTLADKDAESFAPLAEAYKHPGDKENMEKCLRGASAVPLEIMKKCCEGIELMEGFAAKGSRLALSDAGAGAVLLSGALKSASLNVYINAKSMTDREYAGEITAEADSMITVFTKRADKVFEDIRRELK